MLVFRTQREREPSAGRARRLREPRRRARLRQPRLSLRRLRRRLRQPRRHPRGARARAGPREGAGARLPRVRQRARRLARRRRRQPQHAAPADHAQSVAIYIYSYPLQLHCCQIADIPVIYEVIINLPFAFIYRHKQQRVRSDVVSIGARCKQLRNDTNYQYRDQAAERAQPGKIHTTENKIVNK